MVLYFVEKMALMLIRFRSEEGDNSRVTFLKKRDIEYNNFKELNKQTKIVA